MPDLNPGDKAAEDRFKEVSGAYDLLGEPEKRARFDRGEIDASGAERPERRFYRDYAGETGHAYANDADFADFAGVDDALSELFGRARHANARPRGRDQQYRLSFLDNQLELEIERVASRLWTNPNRDCLRPTVRSVVESEPVQGRTFAVWLPEAH